MIKAILFDFGGTLDTDGIHWSEKYWDIYKSLKVSFLKEQYEEAYLFSEKYMKDSIHPGDSYKDTITFQILYQLRYMRSKKYLTEADDQFLLSKAIKLCYSDIQKVTEQNIKIVKQLSGKYILGVVSNFYGNLENVLKELSMYEFFDVIIDSFDVGIEKPNPQIFQLALDRIKTTPDETIVIGDSYDRDICPAKKIGCTTIWLDGKSWTRPSVTVDADYTIKSLSQIFMHL